MSKRWAILQHTLSKESLEGLHFDLLLEDRAFCRTWRLTSIPIVNGPVVEAVSIASHKLYWLDRQESFVSGGRGWAKRIVCGIYHGSLRSINMNYLSIEIHSNSLNGQLILRKDSCQIFSFA